MQRFRWTSRAGGMAMLGVAALLAAQGKCAAGGKIPCKYDVEILQNDCGLFPSFIQAGGIAEDGSIAGMFEACSPPNDRGFLWLPDGTFIPITLPYSPFLYQLAATDVNDAHQVVGTYSAPGNGIAETGFIYEAGRITPLGTLPGGNFSQAHAVNRHGVIAGEWGNHSGGSAPGLEAFIFQKEVMIGLGGDLGTPSSVCHDINDAGQATGWIAATSYDIDARAFIWKASKVTELPPLPGGTTSVGLSINSTGDVVGWGALDDGGALGTIQRAYAYLDGKAIILGVLPGLDESSATAVNDDDIIVGFGYGGSSPAGFVWAENVMRNLNDLVDPKLEITIHEATGINGFGQIAAGGSFDGWSAVFRLTPVKSKAGDLNCDGQIDSLDLRDLLSVWGTCDNVCPADLDGTGIVNGFDLAMLLASWG